MNIRYAGIVLSFCFLISKFSFAQGILPGFKEDKTKPAEPAPEYVLIGNPVPDKLNVTTANGNSRALLSYKPANDVLVVGFFSAKCPLNQEKWGAIRRLYQEYKEWHAIFIGVSVLPDETRDELDQLMAKDGLTFTVVRDEGGHLAHKLHVLAVPQIVVIDEYGHLRFRGNLKDARQALDDTISHEDLKMDLEPQNIEGCPIP